MVNATLPSSFKGVSGLAFHMGIKHGKIFIEGKGIPVYSQQNSGSRLVQIAASGFKVNTDPNALALTRQATFASSRGDAVWQNNTVLLPTDGLVMESKITNRAINTLDVSVTGDAVATLTTDSNTLKPQGGASNKVTITNGGSGVEEVSIHNITTFYDIVPTDRYVIGFRAKASAAKTIQLRFVNNAFPTIEWSDVQSVNVGTTWGHHLVYLTCNALSAQSARLRIDCGGNTNTLWFSNLDAFTQTFASMAREYDTSATSDVLYVNDTFNQARLDEGTMLVRGFYPFHSDDDANNPTPYLCELYINDDNRIFIGKTGATIIALLIVEGVNVGICSNQLVTALEGVYHNYAYSWKNGRQLLYIDGQNVMANPPTDALSIPNNYYVAGTKITLGSNASTEISKPDGIFMSGKDNGLFLFRRALDPSELTFITRRDNLFT